jgi:hypothetical protein
VRQVKFNSTTRTYATIESAEKAAAKIFPQERPDVRMIVASDGKRFSPVFVLNRDSMFLAMAIADRGFLVVG